MSPNKYKKRKINRKRKIIFWCCVIPIILILISIILFFIVVSFNERDRNLEKTFISNVNDIEPNNVHIFMTFDEKYGEKIANNTSTINKKYADKYGFNFYAMDFDTGDLTPHYKKFFGYLYLMDILPKDSYIIYIDGDAALLNSDLDIRKWVPSDPDTYILFGNEMLTEKRCKLMCGFRNIVYKICGNAGVIIVKNNDWSQHFIKNIIEYGKYKKGILHDQGTIDYLYKNNENNERKHIKVIPIKNAIQHHKISNMSDNCLVYHPVGTYRSDRLAKKFWQDKVYNKRDLDYMITMKPEQLDID